MNFLRRYGVTVFLLLVALVMWLSRGQPVAPVHELVGATMGTSYSIKLAGLPAQVSPDAIAEHVTMLLNRLDREVMSTYVETSELSRFNRSAPGEFMPVSRSLAEVVQLSLEISELTGGAFDITVGPLVNRWGFGPRNRNSTDLDATRIPDEQELASLLELVGYRHVQVQLDPPALLKLNHVYLDLSGIAKGYAVDRVADYLDELGFLSYFIEIGGELRIRGIKPDGESWIPAMEKPVDTAPQVYTVFYTHGESIAVSGSGDYRIYFEQDGVRYSHEIDPRTGRPISHALAAVYVIAQSAARTDALATAFMIMGEEEAFSLAEANGIAAYFIRKGAGADEFVDRHTREFARYLQKPEAP